MTRVLSTEATWPHAVTIDGTLIVPGLRVIDGNIDVGTVTSLDLIDSAGTSWWNVQRDCGGTSMMDGSRLRTRLMTNSFGMLIASEVCDCGTRGCDCGCVLGNYPCEHGEAGAGC